MNHQNHTQAHAPNKPRPAENRKAALRPALLFALAVCLLVLPASAHLSPEGSASSALFTTNNGLDNCRLQGFKEACTSHDGVSGSYVNYYENKYVDDGGLLFPGDYYGTATTWCDMEVQGSGSGDQLLDEERVNDEPTPGVIADGTWDDGGIGGACHTTNHYEEPGYDSPPGWLFPGCGGSYAYAKDAVSGGWVWIGAGCDFLTTPEPMSFELCVFNELLSDPTPSGLIDCLGDPVAPFESCGGDGLIDVGNYGYGGSGVPYPTMTIITDRGCLSEDSNASVLTYNYINLQSNEVVPATMGWIDSQTS